MYVLICELPVAKCPLRILILAFGFFVERRSTNLSSIKNPPFVRFYFVYYNTFQARVKYFIPVHGEFTHLNKHAELAYLMGIDPENVFLLENGKVLEITNNSAKATETVQAGRVFVDGLGVGDVGNIVLRDRKHLAEDGVIVVCMTMDSVTHEVVAGPEVISRGFVYVKESEELMTEINELVCNILGITGTACYGSFGTYRNGQRSLHGFFFTFGIDFGNGCIFDKADVPTVISLCRIDRNTVRRRCLTFLWFCIEVTLWGSCLTTDRWPVRKTAALFIIQKHMRFFHHRLLNRLDLDRIRYIDSLRFFIGQEEAGNRHLATIVP